MSPDLRPDAPGRSFHPPVGGAREGPLLVAALLLALAAPLLAGGARAGEPLLTPAVQQALSRVREQPLQEHVRVLSADAMEGRDTASPGARRAAEYLAAQLEQRGLHPAGDAGSYFQQVPLTRSRMDLEASRVVVRRGREETVLRLPGQVQLQGISRADAELEGQLVFAGYGIRAPEYGWDDYAGLDVRGKVVLVLAGEPTSPDPAFFEGERDTRHAGGGAKVALAAGQGAAALITLLTPRHAARYPWEQRTRSFAWWATSLRGREARPFPTLVVREEGARALLAGTGLQWETLVGHDLRGQVRPSLLAAAARLELRVRREEVRCPNVVALLPGSDPILKSEAVVFSAHYDHLGRREPRAGDAPGDTIYNGAWDNASGTAAVLEIARALSQLRPAPRRSVIFLLTTAEEKGLLGSEYYVSHPAIPIERTAANVNLDMPEIFGVPRELVAQGAERGTLERSARLAASALGMRLGADPNPELNTFTRSDHYSFVRAGVPSVLMRWSGDYEDLPAEEARRRAREKMRTIYHQVTDEYDAAWSWAGLRKHTQAALLLGLHVANETEMPAWNEGDAYARPRMTPALRGPGMVAQRE